MSRLCGLIKAFLPQIESQQERDDAYLAQSVDLNDLEHRMRELDARGRHQPRAVALSIGLR